MKHSFTTRLISFVLSLLMVFGMLPLDAFHVHAHATETHSVDNEDTNLEIDYNRPPYKVDENGNPVYDENGNLIYLEPLQALSEAAESGREIDYTYNGKDLTYDDFYSDDYSEPQWRQVFKGDFDKLRQWLESDDPDDRYIVLMEDIKKTIGGSSNWEAIEIKSQKVLDLNGHTLEFYDKRNGTEDQNSENQFHRSNFITINGTGYTQGDDPLNPKHGALLTVIDSAGSNVTITNPKGEIAVKEKVAGRIYANGYMINHQKWDFWWYTHRDLFWVLDGDLVIYGGEFQAGRQKDQAKSNFTWGNLKTVIGDAVAFGTSIFEYASGITAAEAARSDLMGGDMFKDLKEDIAGSDEDEKDTGKTNNGKTNKKDGSGGTEEKKTDTPTSQGEDAAKKDQTVAQKQNDKNSKGEDEAKKGGDSKENKAETGKDAKPSKKDPTDSQIAEANKNIGAAYLDKDKISGMVDSGIKMIEGIWDLFTSDPATIATACIHGTVARIGGECAVVIYDGNFIGHGSTPNVRNAVFEVYHNPNPSATLEGKTQGGLMYIYGGTFTANAGANVFNMYKTNGQPTAKMYEIVTTETVDPVSAQVVYTHSRKEVTKNLDVSETFGVEEVRYENLEKWAEKYYAIPEAKRTEYEALQTSAEKAAYKGLTDAQKAIIDEGPEPVNTANIMVRGGAFRTYYEISMMAVLDARTKGTDESDGQWCPVHEKYGDDCDDVDHNKFIGTPGTVNLGVESFGEDMIRDGRIQLVDVYGQGKLVLLDGGDPIYENPEADPYAGMTEEEILEEEQKKREEEGGETFVTPVNTYQTEGGFRQYRLYISDLELRAMQYLTVQPNTALTNSTNASFALKTYWGTGNSVAVEGWAADDENIRAPYSSNEHYFEYQFDAPEAQSGVYIMPELGKMDFDAAGEDLATSDVWYYNTPVNASGEPLGNFQFMDTYMSGHYVDEGGANDAWWVGGMIGGIIWTLKELLRDGKMITGDYEVSMNRLRKSGTNENTGKYKDKLTNKDYYTVTDENYRTNIKFFVYRVYRVDPLSRENINESDEWAADEPLLEMRYGATNDSLKCKITLAELEKAIAAKKGDPDWRFRSGELYRVTFSVEEHLGYGYLGSQKDGEVEFVNHLQPARAESSILFRCVSINENKDGTHTNTNGTSVEGKVPDWTPLQFVKQDANGNYYKDENVTPGSYATVELLNGQTGIIDYEGARIFDVYYQWYVMDDPDGTNAKLIAGTNDVWVAQNPYGGKQFHKPGMWALNADGTGVNGKIYASTVDPSSALAKKYEFNAYGMPVDQDDWIEEGYQMLHMYTYETCNAHPGMIKDPDKGGLYMANNNTFWGNSDSIYVPAEYAGKYLQCKLVAVNTRYPQVFDNLQTIESHIVRITGIPHPGFESVTPEPDFDFTMGGSNDLGRFYIEDVPEFAFTANALDEMYTSEGYHLKLTTEDYANGELVYSAENGNAYTPTEYGDHEVVQTITIYDIDNEIMNSVSFHHYFTIRYRPIITYMSHPVTEEELAAGEADLGILNENSVMMIVEEIPQYLKDQGYSLVSNAYVYQNGELVDTKENYPAFPHEITYVPTELGDYTVKLVSSLIRPSGTVESSVSFTYHFTRSFELEFLYPDPAITDAELVAGVTNLGTIKTRRFTFHYVIPEWVTFGYNVEHWVEDYVDGTRDTTITVTSGVNYESVDDMEGINWVNFWPNKAGSHETKIGITVKNASGTTVREISHTYKYTINVAPATSVDISNNPYNYLTTGQTLSCSASVKPAAADQTITWSSDNPNIASVSSSGLVTAGSQAGTTRIVATSSCGKHSDYIYVSVSNSSTKAVVGGVAMMAGQYLAQDALAPTGVKPADNYAYLHYVNNVLTLTLHNFSYKGVGYLNQDEYGGGEWNAIYATTAMNIELEGENNLDCLNKSGILLPNGGTISGSGTLNITRAAFAIEARDGNLTISSGTINITNSNHGIYLSDGDDSGDGVLTISGGTINANVKYRSIYSDYTDINITGGFVNCTATSTSSSYNCVETLHGDLTISGSPKIHVEGATNAIYVYYGNFSNTCSSGNRLYAEGAYNGLYVVGMNQTCTINYDCNMLLKSTNTSSDSSYQALKLYSGNTPTFSSSSPWIRAQQNNTGAGYQVVTTSTFNSNFASYDFVCFGSFPDFFGVKLPAPTYYDKDKVFLFDGCMLYEGTYDVVEAVDNCSGTIMLKDGVITLNNYHQTEGFLGISGWTDYEIRLIGENVFDSMWFVHNEVTFTGDGNLTVPCAKDWIGIGDGYLVFSHTGVITIGSDNAEYGMYEPYSITVNSGTVNIYGSDNAIEGNGDITPVQVNGGSLNLESLGGAGAISYYSLVDADSMTVMVCETLGDTPVRWDGVTNLKNYDAAYISHKHVMTYTEPVERNCVVDGVAGYYTCSDCGKMYLDEAGTKPITSLSQITTAATGHSWKAATCDNPKTCRNCMLTEGEALGHTWVEATCEIGKHCSVCFETEGTALPHTLDEGTVTKEATCSEEGVLTRICLVCRKRVEEAIPVDPNAHVITSHATCAEPAKCDACGLYIGLAAAHDWVEATCDAPKTCASCGATEGEALGHNWVDATCDHPKLCTNCGKTEGSALTHSWKAATCSEPKTCTRCWATEGKALGHTWDVNDCSVKRTCSVCGITREAGEHSIIATSTTAQQHTGVCESCGKTVTENHAFDSGTETKAATCTETGEMTLTCTVCYYTRTETIPALGHDYEDGKCTRCGELDPDADLGTKVANGWSGDLTWILYDSGTLVFSGTGNMKNYGYNGGQPWLNKGVDVKRVVIEEGVKSVGSGAFRNLTTLKSVKFPATTLTKMGEAAFYGSGLTSVEIPASLWTIQPYTFKNCANLTSVKFHEGNLQKISDGSFYGTGLTKLVLPDCLTILDIYAFKGCSKLTDITIGSGLTELREAVFYGTAIPTIEIPEGITKIGPYAFKNCVKLETVDFPSTLTSVGEASFYANTALKAVDLPAKVTTIGNYAFRKCAAIETLNLSTELVTVGECAFYGCTGITTLVIPDKVTTIKPYAFKTCTGLTSVTLGKKVATIGEGAFNTCTGLKTIVFPASLKEIGPYCFSGSYNIWKMTFLGDGPAIGTGAFKGLTATAYYPGGNLTWTAEIMQNYGGKITWKNQ